MTFKQGFVLAVTLITLAIVAIGFNQLAETNEAGNVQVKQAAITGNLTCKLDPGMYGKFFGTIHTYKEASTFHFSANSERGDGSLPTRFSDATKASVSGTVRVLLPVTDCDSLVHIHRKFKSFKGVMAKLVEPAMRKALFHAGPHMTAAESYASRRGEFATLTEDQLVNGVIKTSKLVVESLDPLTGRMRKVETVQGKTCEIEDDTTCIGGYERDLGVFREFGIKLTNFVIDGIKYPEVVLKQIETQRNARMNIITQEAEAREADARAKKAEAEARAKVAETRAVEEVAKTEMIVRAEATKAKATLKAEQVRDVAELERDAALFEKQKQILLGEGEATRKRLVMKADGALEKKLAAQVEIQKNWAAAFANRKVPHTVFGGNGGSGAGHGDGDVQNLLKLLTVDTAKRLSLDDKIQ